MNYQKLIKDAAYFDQQVVALKPEHWLISILFILLLLFQQKVEKGEKHILRCLPVLMLVDLKLVNS